jgi:hypothetical protein
MSYRGTTITGGIARQTPLVNDLGNSNIWSTASTGVAGIDAVRTAAGADLGNNDIIITGFPATPEYFMVRADSYSNLHVLPINLPNGDSLVTASVLGFAEQVPDDGDWTESNSGSGDWAESSGLVTGTSPTTGSNRARAAAGDHTADTVLLVLENLSGVINANNELELIGAVSTSNRYASLRNTSGNWNLGGTTDTGQAVTTAGDLEMLCDGPANSVYYRWGRHGSWSAASFTSTFALSVGARWNIQTSSAGNPASASMNRAVLVTI